jgi:hypothetical protein
MTVADVAERTSSAVGSDADTGALFDETAGAYSRLRIRSEGIIIDLLSQNMREALRPYRHINPWSSLTAAPSSNPTALSPTAELDPLLTYLSASLGFLARALAPAPLRRITRALLHALSAVLWDAVLTRHHFSTAGATQLAADLGAICRIVDSCVGAGVAEAGLRKCGEGVRLVSLPAKGKAPAKSKAVAAAADDDDEEEEWEGRAWDAEDDAEAGGVVAAVGETDAAAADGLGLWEVERRLFADNQSARDVLEELGMEALTEVEARAVLGRRVELGS